MLSVTALAEEVRMTVAVIEEVRARVSQHLDAHAGENVAAITKTGKIDDSTRAALSSAVGDLAKEVAAGLQPKATAA